MFLDLRPNLIAGVCDQPGGVGGRITVEESGAHMREQISGHRLLAVMRTPLVTLDKDLVGGLDPRRRGVRRDTQQSPQGGGTDPIPLSKLPQLGQAVTNLAPQPRRERLDLLAGAVLDHLLASENRVELLGGHPVGRCQPTQTRHARPGNSTKTLTHSREIAGHLGQPVCVPTAASGQHAYPDLFTGARVQQRRLPLGPPADQGRGQGRIACRVPLPLQKGHHAGQLRTHLRVGVRGSRVQRGDEERVIKIKRGSALQLGQHPLPVAATVERRAHRPTFVPAADVPIAERMKPAP